MSNELTKFNTTEDLNELAKLTHSIMQTPHYAKIGQQGVAAILHKARSMGIHPIDALNGALYFVQGKVEMTSQTMNRLIRAKGHSIQRDPESTSHNCILNGKRADNGDVWTSAFGVADAKKAGIYKANGPWEKYPENMCFARALSNLARWLFPDVIVDVFVEREILDAPDLYEPVQSSEELITPEEVATVEMMIYATEDPDKTRSKLAEFKITDTAKIPKQRFKGLVEWLRKESAKPIEAVTVCEIIPSAVEPEQPKDLPIDISEWIK